MPIYLMFIRVLLSVEFCFTLKTYLKGAPFYNASDGCSLPRNMGWVMRQRLCMQYWIGDVSASDHRLWPASFIPITRHPSMLPRNADSRSDSSERTRVIPCSSSI